MKFSPLQRVLAGAAVTLIAVGLGWQYLPSPTALKKKPETSFDWPAQVSHFAGNGQREAADGVRGAAAFAEPWGLARDAAGNVYVAEGAGSNRIRRIAADGTVSTLAGGREGFADGPGATASFNTPSGIALDGAGNLYVADTGNHAIRKVTPQGEVTTLAGDGKAGVRDGSGRSAQFNGPVGLTVDAQGRVWVADTYNDRIRMIGADGSVTTVAGSVPGFADGAGAAARFDTPTSIALLPDGALAVADLRNAALRRIEANGKVSTLARSDKEDKAALLRRPLALAATNDGHLYIADAARGRILQRAPDGRLRGLTGVGIDFEPGETTVQRFAYPAGIVIDKDGALLVSDAGQYGIRRVETKGATPPLAAPAITEAPLPAQLPWPVNPRSNAHEIVGTMGEVRGEHNGDARHHFHGGLDVQAALGAAVYAIASEKAGSVTPNWGEDTLNEGLSLDALSYIHMKVGRNADGSALDAQRMPLVQDEEGKLRVRIRRGTRFNTGEQLGSVNRMYHVHLEYGSGGAQRNPLALPLAGIHDKLAPVIEAVWLQDDAGQRLSAARDGRVTVPANASLHIVADAWDRMDGTLARRRLGLYRLGYQLLRADGTPLAGFEAPRITQQYDRLPADRETVKVAYAEASGITVYGNKETRFLYEVTNTLQDGVAKAGSWSTEGLAAGEYVLRIHVADFAGNVATSGRDLRIVVH